MVMTGMERKRPKPVPIVDFIPVLSKINLLGRDVGKTFFLFHHKCLPEICFHLRALLKHPESAISFSISCATNRD